MLNSISKPKKPGETFLALLSAIFSLVLTILAVKYYPDLVTASPHSQVVQSESVNSFFLLSFEAVSVLIKGGIAVCVFLGGLLALSLVVWVLEALDVFDILN